MEECCILYTVELHKVALDVLFYYITCNVALTEPLYNCLIFGLTVDETDISLLLCTRINTLYPKGVSNTRCNNL